jgi:hypothetical protein
VPASPAGWPGASGVVNHVWGAQLLQTVKVPGSVPEFIKLPHNGLVAFEIHNRPVYYGNVMGATSRGDSHCAPGSLRPLPHKRLPRAALSPQRPTAARARSAVSRPIMDGE